MAATLFKMYAGQTHLLCSHELGTKKVVQAHWCLHKELWESLGIWRINVSLQVNLLPLLSEVSVCVQIQNTIFTATLFFFSPLQLLLAFPYPGFPKLFIIALSNICYCLMAFQKQQNPQSW